MKTIRLLALLVVACAPSVFTSCDRFEEADLIFPEDAAQSIPVLTSLERVTPGAFPAAFADFLAGTGYADLLDRHGLQATEYYMLEADNDYSFYGVRLFHTNDPAEKERYLLIYPFGDAVKTRIVEQERYRGYDHFNIYETESYSLMFSGDFVHGAVGARQGTCADNTDTFGACMDCALNVLLDDWLGTAVCMAAPWSCLGAATIHCL